MVVMIETKFVRTPLFDRIRSYASNPKHPFHMPAHCGGRGIHPELLSYFGENTFKADLTELDELDNYHEPENVIKETQEKIAEIFNARKSFMLINGSTVGIMTLMMALAGDGDKIICNRNAHRSIINGLVLTGAVPVWYLPEWLEDYEVFGPVLPETIETALSQNADAKAVFITNPTYEGVISNIHAISKICNSYSVPLIVDEAHGAHWNFSDMLPHNAIELGADASVQSMHKSGGSLSQSSLLHIARESALSDTRVEEILRLLQSTSPSYLLLASLDAATSYLASVEGREILENTIDLAINLKNELDQLNNVNLLKPSSLFSLDPTRIFVSLKNLSGKRLADVIEDKYHIAIESYNNKGNLFFINIGNTAEEVNYLFETLKKIANSDIIEHIKSVPVPVLPEMVMAPRAAYFAEYEKVLFKFARGKIARYPRVKCPPGVSMMIPGERITAYHDYFFDPELEIEVVKS
jgi:arginine/lysine/ornithine decarboxylase